MASKNSWQGVALNEHTREIRLILMDQAATPSSDALALTLIRVKLADANPFYALSYVCGAETPTEPVIVNSQEVLLRPNIWRFLHTIRKHFWQANASRPDLPIRFWLDCLCIDQHNIKERNAQVSMMGDIYKAADKVYSWLGSTSEEEEDALGAIAGRSREQWNDDWELSSWQDRQDLHRRVSLLAANPYWSRMWIKQEMLLAKDVWVFCGKETANWKALYNASSMDLTSNALWRRSSLQRNSTSDRAMETLLELRADGCSVFQLPQLVSKFHAALCLDPRDRLFSIVSLLDPVSRLDLVVDYDKHLLQILLETYPSWTGERCETINADKPLRQVSSYQTQSFCSQMSRLLPRRELQNLCNSVEARRRLSIRGGFRTSALFEVASVTLLGATSGDDMLPLSSSTSTRSGNNNKSCAYAVDVQVNESIPGQPVYRRHFLMYMSAMPNAGDYLTRLASKILLLRSSECAVEGGSYQTKLTVIASGTDFSMAMTPLQNEHGSQAHQRHLSLWSEQQLLDATYELVDGSIPQTGMSCLDIGVRFSGVQVLCNAAAIVALLAESDLFEACIR